MKFFHYTPIHDLLNVRKPDTKNTLDVVRCIREMRSKLTNRLWAENPRLYRETNKYIAHLENRLFF